MNAYPAIDVRGLPRGLLAKQAGLLLGLLERFCRTPGREPLPRGVAHLVAVHLVANCPELWELIPVPTPQKEVPHD